MNPPLLAEGIAVIAAPSPIATPTKEIAMIAVAIRLHHRRRPALRRAASGVSLARPQSHSTMPTTSRAIATGARIRKKP